MPKGSVSLAAPVQGRVGQGEYQSYCILLGSPSPEEGSVWGDDAVTDGFIWRDRFKDARSAGFRYQARRFPGIQVANLADDIALVLKPQKPCIF